jgi:hypothetical protein
MGHFSMEKSLNPGSVLGGNQHCHLYICDVSGRQNDSDRSAAIIGQTVDFACSSATRRADRLRPRPPFEPCAERCALTWVLSMESSSGTGPDAAIFSKMRCQMRHCDQRW